MPQDVEAILGLSKKPSAISSNGPDSGGNREGKIKESER